MWFVACEERKYQYSPTGLDQPTSSRCHSVWQPNPSRRSTYRRGVFVQTTGASSVRGILMVTKLADLSFMQPNKFELGVNLKTAKILGLSVPPRLLRSSRGTCPVIPYRSNVRLGTPFFLNRPTNGACALSKRSTRSSLVARRLQGTAPRLWRRLFLVLLKSAHIPYDKLQCE